MTVWFLWGCIEFFECRIVETVNGRGIARIYVSGQFQFGGDWNMNKIRKVVASLLFVFVLAGCGVSQKDLMENDWELTRDTEEGNIGYKINFSEEQLTLSVKDMSDVSNQMQNNMFEGLITSLMEMMKISYNYQVDGNKLSLQNTELKVDLTYKMKKEGDNIRLTEIVEDENTEKSGFDNALLKPIDNESQSKNNTAKSYSDDELKQTYNSIVDSYFQIVYSHDQGNTDAVMNDVPILQSIIEEDIKMFEYSLNTSEFANDAIAVVQSIQAAVNHINYAYKNGLEVDNDLIGEPGYKFGQILTKYFNGEATPVQKEFLQIYS